MPGRHRHARGVPQARQVLREGERLREGGRHVRRVRRTRSRGAIVPEGFIRRTGPKRGQSHRRRRRGEGRFSHLHAHRLPHGYHRRRAQGCQLPVQAAHRAQGLRRRGEDHRAHRAAGAGDGQLQDRAQAAVRRAPRAHGRGPPAPDGPHAVPHAPTLVRAGEAQGEAQGSHGRGEAASQGGERHRSVPRARGSNPHVHRHRVPARGTEAKRPRVCHATHAARAARTNRGGVQAQDRDHRAQARSDRSGCGVVAVSNVRRPRVRVGPRVRRLQRRNTVLHRDG